MIKIYLKVDRGGYSNALMAYMNMKSIFWSDLVHCSIQTPPPPIHWKKAHIHKRFVRKQRKINTASENYIQKLSKCGYDLWAFLDWTQMRSVCKFNNGHLFILLAFHILLWCLHTQNMHISQFQHSFPTFLSNVRNKNCGINQNAEFAESLFSILSSQLNAD